MTAGSLVLIACLVIAVVIVLASRRRERGVDLGTVSHQWMAEQRIGQSHDRQH